MKTKKQLDYIKFRFKGKTYGIPIFILKSYSKSVIAYTWYNALLQVQNKIAELTGYTEEEIIKEMNKGKT